ncbi:MAG TPA: DUF433 domain-containing protein [Tepidisphaeraceae bacterium]|jgi:uncharacterized protein (DUF433 family)|nr:DUF433 domain-containing protein [Tepidisphaeraceae bacterium]
MVSSTAQLATPREDRELISPDSPLADFISVNPARLHGEPCFRGTRVPIQVLFDHLRGGDRLEDFLAGFPDVEREQAVAVIDLAAMGFLAGLRNL